MQIVDCPRCAVKNRIHAQSDGLKAICGKCGADLINGNKKHSRDYLPQNTKSRFIPSFILIILIIAVGIGIIVTAKLMHNEFSQLIEEEREITQTLIEQHEIEITSRRATFERELLTIDTLDLRRKATNNYNTLLEARTSFDKKYALSPREKALLRMSDLSHDSTKSLHETILSIAKEASPTGAEIDIQGSPEIITLHINFDMSSMTSGEHGTRTKHDTIISLRNEVVYLTSRATNDIFQFCKGLNIKTIHVGCRHYVQMTYPDGSVKDVNFVLYKVSINTEVQNPQLTSNPYLNVYSTTEYFTVDEDNLDEIEIILQ